MGPSTNNLFKAMADATRQRLLMVLSRQELSVTELVGVLGLPQSTISRHLKVLREAGLLSDRRVGAAVLQAARPLGGSGNGGLDLANWKDGNGRPAAELRERVLEWAAQEALDERTRERMEQAIQRRQVASDDFFERIGTRWDQLRIECFGEAFHLEALTALLPGEWTVADIGTGTGYLLPILVERFARVLAVEPAGAMLEAARSRPELKATGNVEFREGLLPHLPLTDGEADLAIASLVLHHVPKPVEAMQELRRVVRADGRLLIIEQHEHAGDEFHERMGDYWRGFEPPALLAWVAEAGFREARVSPLTQVRPAGRQTGPVPGLYTVIARV
jgi:ubiquinone/menaquinone biosynthesis C-methylase UbiE